SQNGARAFQNTFSTAFQSISSGIQGVIMRTETWRQALTNIGTSILSSIVQGIVNMGVSLVAQQILVAVTGKAIAAASTAMTAPIAAAQSAIWAVPATLATIASYGGAAAAAPGLIAAAEGITLSQSILKFAGGGLVPGGPQIIGINEAGPEYVMKAPAVNKYGTGLLDALNNMSFDPDALYGLQNYGSNFMASHTGKIQQSREVQSEAAASSVGGKSRQGSGVNVQGHQLSVAFLTHKNQLKEFLQSAEGKAMIIDIARENRLKIGIPT